MFYDFSDVVKMVVKYVKVHLFSNRALEAQHHLANKARFSNMLLQLRMARKQRSQLGNQMKELKGHKGNNTLSQEQVEEHEREIAEFLNNNPEFAEEVKKNTSNKDLGRILNNQEIKEKLEKLQQQTHNKNDI
ncbi:hypothetical protein AKO1_008282 [Acrasis kona]|uniref:Uncharacterized protein n=1 Tax=Acrasis kona TaxID=1008807 RepID=A0AAW2YRA3_9EUKA